MAFCLHLLMMYFQLPKAERVLSALATTNHLKALNSTYVTCLLIKAIIRDMKHNKRSDVSTTITLDIVKEAVNKSNLELLPLDLTDSARIILNETEPKFFSIGRPMVDSIYMEKLSVYIFNSQD